MMRNGKPTFITQAGIPNGTAWRVRMIQHEQIYFATPE